MTTMLERAARAAAEVYGHNGEGRNTRLDEDDAIAIVRAVLLAIREPDDQTVFKAGRLANDTSFKGLGRLTITHAAMIDAILGDQIDPKR